MKVNCALGPGVDLKLASVLSELGPLSPVALECFVNRLEVAADMNSAAMLRSEIPLSQVPSLQGLVRLAHHHFSHVVQAVLQVGGPNESSCVIGGCAGPRCGRYQLLGNWRTSALSGLRYWDICSGRCPRRSNLWTGCNSREDFEGRALHLNGISTWFRETGSIYLGGELDGRHKEPRKYCKITRQISRQEGPKCLLSVYCPVFTMCIFWFYQIWQFRLRLTGTSRTGSGLFWKLALLCSL
ncbi:hypothetical protein C8R47DRAFT_38395 [Mycena vitilis]|nr:hypothetical protein C8R47DRAFT_38395 [Mycena vitilis]